MDSVFEKLKIPTFFIDILYLLAGTLFSRLIVYVPSAVACIENSLRPISKYFLNHRVVFVIANVIVIVLFLLSRQHDDEKSSDDEVHSKESVVGSYGGEMKVPEITEVSEKADTEVSKCLAPQKSAGFEDLQVVQPNKNICQSNEKTEKGSMNNGWSLEETDVDDRRLETERRIMQHSSEIDEAKRRLKKFQENQSEKLKRAISIGHKPELRPSVSNKSPMLFKSERGWQTVHVDSLSNDEFRLVVETFIEQQQRLIMSEETDNFLLDSN